MESFKNAIIQTLEPDSYERLFESFMKNIIGYASIKQILDLFKYRVDWLQDKLNNAQKFSWSMLRKSAHEKEFEDFLKSENRKMTLNGFDSIKQAREFAKNYGGQTNGYSIEIGAYGIGKDSYVTITKTKKYHEDYLKTLTAYKAELAKIKELNLNI